MRVSTTDLISLVDLARHGDVKAYNQLVIHFQDRAVAYAYATLGDFHSAQDAVQDAFIEAYQCLPSLHESAAFSAWLRRIIFKNCDRQTRKKRVATIEWNTKSEELSGNQPTPSDLFEQEENAREVREAVAALPEKLRVVVVLFYMGGHSQSQISEFLEVPVSTIKKRLFTARQQLKEQMITMIAHDLNENRPSKNEIFAQQVHAFTVQFSRFLDEGESIVRSLVALAEQSSDADFQAVIEAVNQDVQLGYTLSTAMEKHPQAFTTDYIAAVRRGEKGGCLDVELQNLAR